MSYPYFEVVRRTAQHGLDLSDRSQSGNQFRLWLSIWALDVVNESVEVSTAKTEHEEMVELGDVIWGVCASAMLVGLAEKDIIPSDPVEGIKVGPYMPNLQQDKLIRRASQYADYAKKVARDDRPIDRSQFANLLSRVFYSVARCGDPAAAAEAMNQKLLKRYPNGYTAADSINRNV